ncbi:hypothetical protein BT69DRAFT_1297616 [Atractiella rhizophila]|nr:hypothetical protein BT69DRAFT_1297616 [Atractiella rhizophila]
MNETDIVVKIHMALLVAERNARLPLLLYDATTTIFMLLPSVAHMRNAPLSKVLSTFMSDGVLYFTVMSLCNLVNMIYFSQSQNTGPSGSSSHSNIVPKFRNGDVSAVPDVHLQSVGRQMEGGLQVSYAGVIVDVETEINVEKRLEAVEGVSPESKREYHLSDEGVVKKL